MANLTDLNICSRSQEILATGLEENNEEGVLRRLLAKDSVVRVSLTEQGQTRWKPFDAFVRKVNNRTVMSAPKGIVKDLLPGELSLSLSLSFFLSFLFRRV